MMKIPARFDRAAAAYNSFSGQTDTVNLSALVNSFLERETTNDDDWIDFFADEADNRAPESDSDSRYLLENLFGAKNDVVRWKIHTEVEKSLAEIGCEIENERSGFNRRLVAILRGKGFDAGVCKSKCEKGGHRSYHDHEFVDVYASGSRYVVEVFLAGEFTIARPTEGYATLLAMFPRIFVGRPDELKQVVRTMCAAIGKSMKTVGIAVPPWRRFAYVQSKWFGQHERTTEGSNASGDSSPDFFARQVKGILFYCREDFSSATDS
ncbi:Protein of unknown function (DUF506 [Striga hermonthica]|uniref:Uncharacterized protein n=1 Tax=Striga hermonthica TaxID=68872 RepID=A0A9N7N2N6_STRHE|nr:Protein of unknown function (DUF506 [Striga hermonthica]